MKIAVLAERKPGENRVAMTPPTVTKLVKLGAEVLVEPGAGAAARIPDSAYTAQGAQIAARGEALAAADIVLAVRPPPPREPR